MCEKSYRREYNSVLGKSVLDLSYYLWVFFSNFQALRKKYAFT